MSMSREDRAKHERFVQRTDGRNAAEMAADDASPTARTATNDPQPRGAGPALTAGRSSERDDIARRVAAFRDRQRMLRRQREDYYDAMLTKTRAALSSDIKRPQR